MNFSNPMVFGLFLRTAQKKARTLSEGLTEAFFLKE